LTARAGPYMYLLAADIVSGPLPIRLREVNQPVIITQSRFSRPHPCPLACICAYGAPPHHAPQPVSCFRLSVAVATAAPAPGGLPSGTTRGQQTRLPSGVSMATIAWPSPSIGRNWLGQWLAQTRMRQHKVVIDLEQDQLIPQARFALAQGVDPAPDRRHAL